MEFIDQLIDYPINCASLKSVAQFYNVGFHITLGKALLSTEKYWSFSYFSVTIYRRLNIIMF